MERQTPERLFSEHEGLAIHVARQGGFFPPPGQDWDDLRQAARLALWEAARSWQAGRGVAFSTFAGHVIRRRLCDWLSEQGGRARRYEAAALVAKEWAPCLEPWREPDFDGQMRLGIVFRRLAPRHREALLLAVGYGYTCTELAKWWGVTAKQADGRISRARRAACREADALGVLEPREPKSHGRGVPIPAELRAKIARALLAGESERAVTRRFGISRSRANAISQEARKAREGVTTG
jgi:RNA polymerase sigma factor (sigma-70 family)